MISVSDIIAPVDGLVTSRFVEVGQMIDAGAETLLFLIADLAVVRIDAEVVGKDAGEVRVGDTAKFTVGAFSDRTFTGKVRAAPDESEPIANDPRRGVVILASNPDLLLEPGMTATVNITVDGRAE